jgi:hypothetical protein
MGGKDHVFELTPPRRLEVYRPQRRCRRVARKLESERKRTGGQHWRQQGQFVEGEAEWRVGVCEDVGGVEDRDKKKDEIVSGYQSTASA